MSPGRVERICTFQLGSQLFGIDVAMVQEILVTQAITPVPLAAPSIRGVINLRGQIVTVIDLRRRLELPARAADAKPIHIVVRTERELVSFLADRAGDVLDVDVDAFETAPETLRGPAREVIVGAYKLPSSLLLVLDAERAADPEPTRVAGTPSEEPSAASAEQESA